MSSVFLNFFKNFFHLFFAPFFTVILFKFVNKIATYFNKFEIKIYFIDNATKNDYNKLVNLYLFIFSHGRTYNR